ncbi:DUF5753 domain-containing protein [Streptomyces vietnamensis]|uniref:DUF5753 domain-containing protein n=1 Tax=Streptomyces vietnamensis TaxID=362257 RepID=UPI0034286AFA
MLRYHRGDRLQEDAVAAVPAISSVPMLSRLENVRGEMRPDRVEALLRYYGAPEEDIAEALDCLARAKQMPGWSPPSGSSEAFRVLSAMEGRAKVIRVYQESSVPGMLQTRAYATALMEEFARTQRDPELRKRYELEIRERLEFRMRRQLLLEPDEGEFPVFEAIIGEGALLTQRGGKAVHREQLRTLYSLAENRRRIRLRVLPASAPVSGLHNAMTLLKPHDDELGKAVYLENRNRNGELVTEPGEVEAYQQSLEELWVAAGSKEDAMRLLKKYIDQLED